MILTIADLEADIRTRTRASLDAAAQECSRSGHVWRHVETLAGRPAEYCPCCLRLRLAHSRGGRWCPKFDGQRLPESCRPRAPRRGEGRQGSYLAAGSYRGRPPPPRNAPPCP